VELQYESQEDPFSRERLGEIVLSNEIGLWVLIEYMMLDIVRVT